MTPFQHGFLTCALFSTTDESDESGGEPLDANYTIDDFDPETLACLCADCDNFEIENEADLSAVEIRLCDDSSQYRGHTESECRAEQAGHDFWLTRNHHGVGFWDGDYSEPHATRLTHAAHTFGEVYLHIGDDGRIYD